MALLRDQNNPEDFPRGPQKRPNPLGSLGGQDPNDQGGFSGTKPPPPPDFSGIGDAFNPPGAGSTGNGQTPLERMPYTPPTGGKVTAPNMPREPFAGDQGGGFGGGGSSTISPPSISTPIAPPSPDFMVGKGGFKGGSLVGGGLGLPSDSGQSNDPSSLLLSLLQQLGLMGGGGSGGGGMF